jgi:hypothetical protein
LIAVIETREASTAAPALPAMRIGVYRGISTGREKPRISAARADPQPHLLGTFRTVAFVGGLPSICVDPRVRVAADEMDADESAILRGAVLRAVRIVGQIEPFASHAAIVASIEVREESQ